MNRCRLLRPRHSHRENRRRCGNSAGLLEGLVEMREPPLGVGLTNPSWPASDISLTLLPSWASTSRHSTHRRCRYSEMLLRDAAAGVPYYSLVQYLDNVPGLKRTDARYFDRTIRRIDQPIVVYEKLPSSIAGHPAQWRIGHNVLHHPDDRYQATIVQRQPSPAFSNAHPSRVEAEGAVMLK
ncbi:hypothetical protein F4802DRAFT_151882 [Xylaria palmicola]|nr:hypothetical protein F4802DRAFT_151882 [Xylaria palmicola]